ncbi:hypothetical protein E1301_Tti020508 [Triplophysa tibetana]|uniref:Uncharacterized protein n=1 Tax=Triplophysa tibetana TaxID=1572043 RepID=A0A5A9NRN1_9TELE|nr:hypothetical protein E1301_Tti020508 [Triplophysa tibetana]
MGSVARVQSSGRIPVQTLVSSRPVAFHSQLTSGRSGTREQSWLPSASHPDCLCMPDSISRTNIQDNIDRRDSAVGPDVTVVHPEMLAGAEDLAVSCRDTEQISLLKHSVSQPAPHCEFSASRSSQAAWPQSP